MSFYSLTTTTVIPKKYFFLKLFLIILIEKSANAFVKSSISLFFFTTIGLVSTAYKNDLKYIKHTNLTKYIHSQLHTTI